MDVTGLMPQEKYVGLQFTITDLPECIIEKIVSFLSMRDLARMRVSSKLWRNISFTTPFVKCEATRQLDYILDMGVKVPGLLCVLRLEHKVQCDLSMLALSKLECLRIYTSFSDFEMHFIASILGRTTNLKYLAINQSVCDDFKNFPRSKVSYLYWKSLNLELIQHLEVAEVSLCCREENALQMLEYLIKNGRNLRTLTIPYSDKKWNGDYITNRLHGCKQLSDPPRFMFLGTATGTYLLEPKYRASPLT